jgi:hypothetical protein
MKKQKCLTKFFAPLLVVLLVVSFFGAFSASVSGQTTADRTPVRIVSNEMELRNAVNNAVEPTVIALDNDITLTEQLVIPVNKDITLTSTSSSKFFKLIGGVREIVRTEEGYPVPLPDAVIMVEGSGVLKIDGIVVTSTNIGPTWNSLVRVNVVGTLIMYNGEISGNIGDGVCNSGTFEMYGGKISNNTSIVGGGGRGGALYNSEYGTFGMFGGEISNNTGFGVINRGTYNWGWSYGTFNMSGGVISNNNGGGVQNSAIFTMSGGEISNNVGEGENVMQSGGGVSNSGIFSMSGGVISNNQATHGGGVYNYPDGNFSLSGNAVISNNKAEVGGGVYNAGTFNGQGGVISGNTATQYNDVYPDYDSITNDDITNDDNITGNMVLGASIVVIVSIIVGGLFFYSKKSKKQ